MNMLFSSGWGRLIFCAPAALLVSLLLFVAMEAMIRPGPVTLSADRSITLRNFTADKSDPGLRTRQRKISKQNEAKKPPPPPKLTVSRQKPDLPTPKLEGVAPEKIDVDQISNIDVGAVAIDDRDAQPIRPPLCQFPPRAMARGIDGSCDVSLNIDVRGRPYAVKAECNNRLFVKEAERCVSKAEFAPKIMRGKSVERRNIIYPLTFELDK